MKIISRFNPASVFGSSNKSKTRTRKSTHSSSSSSSSSSSIFSSSSSSTNTVTRHELERVLRHLKPDPPTDDEIMTMLAEADRDGNGSISFDEIMALGSGLVGSEGSSELEETFRVFDADGDGKISAEELMGLFVMLGDEDCSIGECCRMIRVVDSDGDGFVCFGDFVRMMEMQR